MKANVLPPPPPVSPAVQVAAGALRDAWHIAVRQERMRGVELVVPVDAFFVEVARIVVNAAYGLSCEEAA